MRKYILAIIAVFFTAAFALAVAMFEFKPIDSLMKPPKIEGENLQIQLAFEAFAGDGYNLITPLKGEHRSAYTFFDLDGDSNDEAIVFYSKSDENDIVRMNILSSDSEGGWKSLADIDTGHSDVQQVEFADLNGDRIKEIIVGWTVFQSEYTKTMNVYMLTEENKSYTFKSIYNSTYSDFRIFDIDCDAVSDILKIDYVKTMDRTEYKAVYLDFKKEKLTDAAEIKLDMAFSSITSVTSDYSESKNQRRLYIDGLKYESGMITDCIYYDEKSGEFKRERSNFPPLSVWSSRITNIVCKDVNSDGIVEVPKEEEIPESEVLGFTKDIVNRQFIIKWTQLDKNQNKPVLYEILNPTYGYSYRIDEKDANKITVINNLKTGVLTFYSLNFTNGYPERGSALFSVIAVKESDSEANDLDFRYKYLKSAGNYSYFCRIYENGEKSGTTKTTIKNNLILN